MATPSTGHHPPTTRALGRVRPRSSDTEATLSRPRRAGIALALVGLVLATVALIGNLVAAGDEATRASTLPWAFGLTTTAFAAVKSGIAVVLWGILMRLWVRADAVGQALSKLVRVDTDHQPGPGERKTELGTVQTTRGQPAELGIHKMAKRMWSPMLIMGAMAVGVGLIISFAWASGGGVVPAAWTQGLQFLGEGMLLASISFLLGTILWGIRTAGGEIQESLGVSVKTLKMPGTAKVFVALMMLGLMVSIVQFVLYLVVAAGGVDPAVWFAWLGPFRELGLALILSGITMALVTIGNALRFQFHRVTELIRDGR